MLRRGSEICSRTCGDFDGGWDIQHWDHAYRRNVRTDVDPEFMESLLVVKMAELSDIRLLSVFQVQDISEMVVKKDEDFCSLKICRCRLDSRQE